MPSSIKLGRLTMISSSTVYIELKVFYLYFWLGFCVLLFSFYISRALGFQEEDYFIIFSRTPAVIQHVTTCCQLPADL